MRRMHLLRPTILFLSLCLAASLFGCARQAVEPSSGVPNPMPTLQVVTVGRSTVEQVLPATGTLAPLPNREATLSPQVSGTLQLLAVQFGQTVQAGQVVAHISTLPILGQIQQAKAAYGQNLVQVEQAQANAAQQEAQTQSGILQAKANWRNAQAGLAAANAVLVGDQAAEQNAEQNLTREQTLYRSGLVAQRDLESAQLAEQTAKSQVEAQVQTVAAQQESVEGQEAAYAAARSSLLEDLVKRKDIEVARQQVANSLGALDSAQAQLSLYTIRSPLSGQVTQIGAGVGESVDPTTKLVTISDLGRLQLTINAPSADARSIQPGDEVLFSAESLPGRTFRTTVDTVSPQVDPVSGSVVVLATIPNPEGLLKDDMTVAARITTARHADAIVVPQSAVLSDPDTGAKSVMTVDAGSVAHTVNVTTGITDDGVREIVSGLSPGDRVASSGQYGITDGTQVKAETIDPGSSAAGSGDASNGP